MKSHDKSGTEIINIRTRRILISVCGIAVNVLLSFFMYKLGFPLYLDTLGTIAVGAVSGFLFPAICTAVATSVICAFFYWPAIYLSFFNIIIAIITVAVVQSKSYKKIGRLIVYILSITVISSFSVSILQYALYGQNDTSLLAQNAFAFSSAAGIPYLLSFCFTNFLLYFMEKGFICIIVSILLAVIPKSFLASFEERSWNQKVISDTARQYISDKNNSVKHPLHKRIAMTFVISSVILVVMTGAIALRLYFDNIKKIKTENAWNCINLTTLYIDASKIEDYIKNGVDAQNYKETLNNLIRIRKSFMDVTYLYVLRIEENGGRFIFDTDEENPYAPGELVPFDKEFEPYLPDLFEGRQIEPVVSNTVFGWLLTIYSPVFNADGETVCYVGVDVSMDYITEYMGSFVIKVLLIMAGFFMLIISYTIWSIGNNMSYPISTIAAYVDNFSDSVKNQEELDENVKQIRSLEIQSGDEIQKLYDAICRMTLGQAEQIRDIRRLSESTVKMQDGLIITMADMVENRDSDTGAHVQKTSAYVKIIVEGLKKKGYYPQKITPKFMSDVVRSAPLHDVGKINISDSVLNKPGKLTDEEFAIMKTHTTAGKEILEKAISTVQGENYLKEARNMAAYHHERWDGKGYPEGLHGEVIPLSARIMAVADVFDALASPRVYKPAFPLEKALEILQEGSGTQFDPKCIEVFMESLPEVKMVLRKYNGGNLAN